MSWSLTAQLAAGTLSVDTTNHIWWCGANFTDSVAVNQYQDSTHVADSNNNQLDSISALHNTKYLSSSTVSLDGGPPSTLPIAPGSCGLLFTFSQISAVTASNSLFYLYDGVEDINPAENVFFQAAEGGQSNTWVAANGLNSALHLADQSSSTTHNYYIATSISPANSGLKSGKIKIVINFA